MKYFKNPNTNSVSGFDETDETQLPLIEEAIAACWQDITGSWPPTPTQEELNNLVLSSIMQLEAANLLPRPLRDLLLKDPTAPSYGKVKALDDQIAALRSQLK